MKINFRKIMALLLAAVMVLALAACGSEKTTSETANTNDDFFGIDENTIADESGENTDTASTGNTSKAAVATNKTGGKSWSEVLASMPKSLRGTTLKMFNWNPTSEYAGAAGVIEKFQKQTGITVKWQTINFDQYQSLLTSAIASGESPDLVRTRTTNPVPLQSLQPISVSGYDFSDAAWDQRVMKDYTYNGNTYATSLKNTHLGTVNILCYNSALINQYDLEDPYQLWKAGKWTWSKFIDVCKKYKKASGAKYAACGNGIEPWYNIHGILAPVGRKDGRFVNISCTSEFINVAQKLADLMLTDEILTLSSDGFEKGEILFFGHASIFARSKNAYFANLKEAGTLTAVPFPSIEGQSKYYVGSGEYEAYGIAKGAKNAQAAPYFLRYFLDAENYDMSAFYSSAQTLEVYNWCMNQEIIPSICFVADTWYGETYEQNYTENLTRTSSSQIKSYLESKSSIIDNRVKELNKAVDALK